MSNLKKNESLLARLDRLENSDRQYLSLLQVKILQLKLKEEKLKDKTIFQSLKDKVATH